MARTLLVMRFLATFAFFGGATIGAQAQCDPVWTDVGSGLGFAEVAAMVTFDKDGAGPAAPVLIVGGDFTIAGGSPAGFVAQWNGVAWSPLGAGLNGPVSCLAVFDDGRGPAVYAGGSFTQAGGLATGSIARWDGSAWSALGSGLSGSPFEILPIHGLPGGPALLVGGFSLQAGGSSNTTLLRWDGLAWSAYAPGGNFRQINALIEADGQLFAGGFPNDGTASSGLARWDGSQWSALGTGITGGRRVVWDLARFDDGAGPAVFVGGEFTTAGGIPAPNIARWDGMSWSALGAGLDNPAGLRIYTPYVNTLIEFDEDGDGPGLARLYAAGQFLRADGQPARHIASWRGSWNVPSGQLQRRMPVLAAYDSDGPGPGSGQLIAGGRASEVGGLQVNHIAARSGTGWTSLGDGVRGGVTGSPPLLAKFDADGGGPGGESLVAVGDTITLAGGRSAYNIAFWDGGEWFGASEGLLLPGSDPIQFDADGAGPERPRLYMVGDGIASDGQVMSPILVFDGTTWIDGPIWTATESPSWLAVHNAGIGPSLYALSFSAGSLFRLEGDVWVREAATVPPGVTVAAFQGVETGPMPGLWIAGWSGSTPNRIAYAARFEAGQWVPRTTGLPSTASGSMFSLAVIDQGQGGQLFIAGAAPIGSTRNGVWRWDAGAWTPEPSALTQPFGPAASIRRIQGWSPQSGDPALLAAIGSIYGIEGVPMGNPALWDGLGWSTVSPGLGSGGAGDLEVFDDDGDGPKSTRLFISSVGSTTDPAQLIWVLGCPPCAADLNGDGLVDFADYLEFLNYYDAQDPRVDFNQDGLVDFGDYLEFLNHYDARC